MYKDHQTPNAWERGFICHACLYVTVANSNGLPPLILSGILGRALVGQTHVGQAGQSHVVPL